MPNGRAPDSADWRADGRRRLAPLALDPTRESEIAEEIAQHLDDRCAELRAGGLPDAEVRRVALDELRGHELLAAELDGVEPRAAAPLAVGAGGGSGWAP